MAPDQGSNRPEDVVRSFVEAYNEGAVEEAVAHYAEGALRDFRPQAMKEDAPFHGRGEIRQRIESDMALNTRVEVDVDRVQDGRIEATARVWSDKFAKMHVEQPMVATDVYVVEDGEIVEHVTEFTDESMARVRAAVEGNEQNEQNG